MAVETMMNPLKMQEMLGQAKAMQEQLQQKMSETIVESNAGGGAVSVRMNGQKQIQKLTIDPSAVIGLRREGRGCRDAGRPDRRRHQRCRPPR